MTVLRRSGRIAKEVPILVVGTDITGKVFSEETTTVLLSRHGAGILSRYKIAPEEILTMRRAGETQEAVIRLVGPMGDRPDGYIYGVAFCDPILDFWRLEFPAASPAQNPAPLETTACECSICHRREFVHHSEIEMDVFAVNDRILRSCEECGTTTNWAIANPDAPAPPPPASPRPPSLLRSNAALSAGPSHGETALTTATLESSASESFYSSDFLATPIAASIDLTRPASAPSPAPPPTPRGKNRRQHLRASVSFTACIRHHSAGDEIVECDNISKGGFCFRSRRQYPAESVIEASVPYTPGWSPVFVSGQIRHVETLPGGNLFRYGVAYLQPAPPAASYSSNL